MTRLFLPELPPQGAEVATELSLDRDRSHYLCRVLRCHSGDGVQCFDGKGRIVDAEVRKADARRCTLVVTGTHTAPPPVVEIHLVQALVKSDLERVVQKCTELGATDFWPVASERSEARTARTARLERVAQSACEQCGRVYVPTIHETSTLAEFLPKAPAASKLIAVPGAPALEATPKPQSCCLLVGPEGGWTADELTTAAEFGFHAFGLGDLTLRATTAGLAALSALRQGWHWQGLGL